ncbi:MAG: hypothetical protein QM778_11365 [Myxococcales bacterium]
MDRSTVIVEDLIPSSPEAAVLTLQRGVSPWASWTFHPTDAGSEITVGSASHCDWQVLAPGIPAVALRFTGHELFVWVEEVQANIRCNGATLSAGFTQLRHEDQLDLGSARLRVWLGSRLAEAARPSMPGAEGPACVELRVAHGTSRTTRWRFLEADVGRAVTVGSAEECDIKIRASGVARLELTVLYAGDTLLVKSARPEGAKLNGKFLPEEWLFVQDGDRIKFGKACLEVRSIPGASEGPRPAADSERSRKLTMTRELFVEPRGPLREKVISGNGVPQAAAVAANRTLRMIEIPYPEAARPQPSARPVVPVVPPPRALPVLPRPSQLPRPAPAATAVALRVASPVPPPPRLPAPALPAPALPAPALPAPKLPEGDAMGCLFEAKRSNAGVTPWRAAGVLVLLASYLGWLALLERWWPGW